MAEDIFHFNILLIPFAFISGVVWQSIYGPLSLLLLLPLIPLHYLLRICVDKLSLFLLLVWITMIFSLSALFILGFKGAIYVGFSAFMCSYCVRRRTSAESKLTINFEGLCFPLVLMAAEYLVATRLSIGFMREFIYYQSAFLLINALVYVHISGINSELELASSESFQSTKFIAGFASKFLLVYIAGLCVILFLFRYVPFGYLTKAIGDGIIAALRYLFSLIPKTAETSTQTAATGGGKDGLMALSDHTVPKWLEILEQIMVYTVNILVLAVILVLIVLFFLKLYRGFYGMNSHNINHFDGQSKVKQLKHTSSTHSLFKLRITDPIRRKYYKRVNKHIKKQRVKAAHTPHEMEALLKPVDDLSDITTAYEQARYDNT
jgi:hypothetical protein